MVQLPYLYKASILFKCLMKSTKVFFPVLSIFVIHVDGEMRPSFEHFSHPNPAYSSNFFICKCCYKQSLLMSILTRAITICSTNSATVHFLP